MNKVLVSDYDRTFYLNDDDIEKNKEYLKKFKYNGNIFILATGRSYFDLKKVVSKYKIDYDFAIINHGATILDKNDNIMFLSFIDNNILSSLITDLKLGKTKNNFFCSKLESRVSINHKNITKINIEYNDENFATEIYNMLFEKYIDYINIYRIGKTKIEVVSKDSSKLKAIKFLENKLSINKNDIYTIGDGYSDIEMIKEYNGFCMKNSVSELKNISKSYSSVSELINNIL